MKKIYTLCIASIVLFVYSAKAQCPTPSGMTAVPISLNGSCFINIQSAWPSSNVSIYNASGFVAQGFSNATGSVVIPYACASNPITSVVSIKSGASPQVCNTVFITQLVTLPIKLVSFTATLSDRKTVLLQWETSLELDNEKYEIQRSSDGINYTTLSSINSNGSGLAKRTYNFEDVSFAAGSTVFYRLRQVDYDGKSTLSKVLYVNDKASTANYSLFPNPISASNNTIQIKGIAASEVTYSNIRITDMAGRNIAFKIVSTNAIEMATTNAPCFYMIRVKDKTLKLVKN